jgi:hypothetical protein
MSVTIKKSGRNLHLELVGETYDEMRTGTVQAGLSQVALSTSVPCFVVVVQSDPRNTTNVIVGNRNNSGPAIVLEPGDTITLPINDVSKVYARSIGAAQVVNWLAFI